MRGQEGRVPQEDVDEAERETRYVVALRRALMMAEAGTTPSRQAVLALEEAARPVVDRCYLLLLSSCDRLAESVSAVPGRARIDGADLAQEAWKRVLRYLATPNGARVQDDTHLLRLLRRVALNYFLDLRGSAAVVAEQKAVALDAPAFEGEGPRSERIAGPATLPDILRFANSGSYGAIIDLLFREEKGFRRAAAAAGLRRHPRQYRAAVLHQLGEYFWQETGGTATESSRMIDDLLRRFAEEFHIPAAGWEAVVAAVRAAVQDSGDEKSATVAVRTALFRTVNQICGTSLKPGNILSVLRYDLRRCAALQEKPEKKGKPRKAE